MTHINGNDLLALGFPENELLGIALKINKNRLGLTKTEMLNHYELVLKHLESYIRNSTKLFDIIAKFTPKLVRMAHGGSRED